MNDSPTPAKTRKWFTPLLFVSLALNLLVVGILAGWLLSPGGPRGESREYAQVRGLVGEPFVRALPKEERRALLRSAVQNRERLRENRDVISRRFAAFLTALEADVFDEATVASLLEEQRQAAIRRQEIGEALLIERLAAMTPEDRKAYAARLSDGLKHLRPRSRSN